MMAVYKEFKKILRKNKKNLIELAKRLLEKEVIFKEDLIKVLGERPFKEKEQVGTTKKTKSK